MTAAVDRTWVAAVDRTWVDRAACAGMPTEKFYPEAGLLDPWVVAICRDCCPVRHQCLEYALTTETRWEAHGIWGGKSAQERRRILRRRGWLPTRRPQHGGL